MDKHILSKEEKQLLKEQRRKERFQKELDKAYEFALKDNSLPEFRIKDGVILIKRISDNKLQQYKKQWLSDLKEQIERFTFEDLCEVWNEPFETNIRKYNPHDLIIQYFYHKHEIDLYDAKIPYKIVDNF